MSSEEKPKIRRGIDAIGVGVVFFCHDGAGKYLLGKRSQNCRDEHGAWDPGGGGVEQGEMLEEALRREVNEEYGATVLSHEFLGFREVHREHNGQRTHWVAFDFKVQVDPATVRIAEPEMMDDLRWVTIDEIPEPMHSQFPAFLEKYSERF